MEFLGIDLTHYGVFLKSFDIFSGPVGFVKDRYGILGIGLDHYGSLEKLLRIAMGLLRIAKVRYGFFRDWFGSAWRRFRFV